MTDFTLRIYSGVITLEYMANERPARASTTDPSLEVVRHWVSERLRWERFLTNATDAGRTDAGRTDAGHAGLNAARSESRAA